MLSGTFSLKTSAHMTMIDITDTVQATLQQHKLERGFCYLFNPHTTAGLTINEGADPDVQKDLIAALQHIVPMKFDYRHREGNSPSHLMASLMGCSLTIAVERTKLQLGTWQRVFFCEFDGPRTRKVHWRLDNNLNQ